MMQQLSTYLPELAHGIAIHISLAKPSHMVRPDIKEA